MTTDSKEYPRPEIECQSWDCDNPMGSVYQTSHTEDTWTNDYTTEFECKNCGTTFKMTQTTEIEVLKYGDNK